MLSWYIRALNQSSSSTNQKFCIIISLLSETISSIMMTVLPATRSN
uniref:Uncharacterized protein n=1 Tax=Rhizophora mucronata TaxID=61149 RepID=A0A2P2PCJ3_RHIMU